MQPLRSSLLALLCAAAASAQSGRPDLVARCVAAVDQSGESVGSIAEIAVENRGATPLEPMEFTLTVVPKNKDMPPRTVRCERLPGPWTGRGGRPALPRSKRSYWVLCPLSAERAREAEVEVTVECDSPREEALDAPVVVVDKRYSTAFVAAADRELPQTVVTVSNRSPRELDALFRVACDEPAKRVGLASLHLQPNETREWTVDEIAMPSGALDGAKLTKIELIDWSVLRAGSGDARRVLDGLFARWQRWPARVPVLEARCRVTVRGASEKTVEGRVVLAADGSPDLRLEFDAFGLEATRIANTVELPFVFQHATRVESEIFSRALDVTEVDRDRIVRFDPPIVLGSLRIGAIAYDDRHFRWHSEDVVSAASGARTLWRTRPSGNGWALEGLDLVQRGGSQPEVEQRFEYQNVAGLDVPVRSTAITYGEQMARREMIEATFEDWRVPAAAKGLPAPTGAQAEQLRAAWSAPYAYPCECVRLSGNFDLRTTVVDPDWLGARRVIGQFALLDFERGRWTRVKIDVTSGEMHEDDRRTLARLFEDRLRAWFARDFAARAPFETAFAGAKLSGASPSFTLENCELASVALADGLPAELSIGGDTRKLGYKRIDGVAPIADQIESERGRYLAEYFVLTPEWRLPRSIEFTPSEKGRGVETLALNNLKISGVNR